jgi:hypothetical protein
MQQPEFQSTQQLEAFLRTMQWEQVSLTPDAQEVATIDQELASEWLQPLEPELEEDIERDVIAPLTAMSIEELNSRLEIPEGDIIENAQASLEQFDLDIDALMQEVETPDIALQQDKDLDDFGR